VRIFFENSSDESFEFCELRKHGSILYFERRVSTQAQKMNFSITRTFGTLIWRVVKKTKNPRPVSKELARV
jgi:hypothetical protein